MRALIVGGGIAGPVTAMALQRVGVDSTIYEAHHPDPDIGSYFTITANGLTALDAVDALDVARDCGFPTRRNVLWNQSGRELARLSLDSTLPASPEALTMKRATLAVALQEEARRRGIPIEYGRRVVEVEMSTDTSPTVTLQDGEVVTGDLLVGADGVHSAVRRAIDPSSPTARYVGLTNFGGITRGAGGSVEPEAWHLIFGYRAFFGYQATPSGDVVWFANVPEPKITSAQRETTSPAGWRDRLIELFSDDVGPAVELIAAGELELVADNTHDLGHVPIWHRGHVIVIGDAAHAPAPTSGQGASMAIEDGVALAAALHDGESVGAAFDSYEKARRERVEKIVAWGARGSSNKVPGRFGRFGRDLMLRFLFRHVITEESTSWMYDYRIGLETGDRV